MRSSPPGVDRLDSGAPGQKDDFVCPYPNQLPSRVTFFPEKKRYPNYSPDFLGYYEIQKSLIKHIDPTNLRSFNRFNSFHHTYFCSLLFKNFNKQSQKSSVFLNTVQFRLGIVFFCLLHVFLAVLYCRRRRKKSTHQDASHICDIFSSDRQLFPQKQSCWHYWTRYWSWGNLGENMDC